MYASGKMDNRVADVNPWIPPWPQIKNNIEITTAYFHTDLQEDEMTLS